MVTVEVHSVLCKVLLIFLINNYVKLKIKCHICCHTNSLAIFVYTQMYFIREGYKSVDLNVQVVCWGFFCELKNKLLCGCNYQLNISQLESSRQREQVPNITP